MTASGELQVAVVGLGVGEQHARAFHAHPACQVSALFDLETARAQALAAEFSGCQVATSFDDLIRDSSLDAISIASFDDHHYEQAMAAIEAGKHVFVEKPICQTASELETLKARWLAARSIKLHSNLVLQAAPLFCWLREEIRTGGLGRIYAFDGDYLYGRLDKITEGWRKDVTNYSVMEGGGIHLIDLLLWLTNERPTNVTAVGNRISTEGTAFRYDDFMAATLEFRSGLVARIAANFGSVHPHQHYVRVFGTKGTFIYDDAGPRVCRSRDPQAPFDHLGLAAGPAHKGDLIPRFVSAILDRADDAKTTQGFFDDVSVCVATDRARQSGQRERIDYV